MAVELQKKETIHSYLLSMTNSWDQIKPFLHSSLWFKQKGVVTMLHKQTGVQWHVTLHKENFSLINDKFKLKKCQFRQWERTYKLSLNKFDWVIYFYHM